MNECVKCLIDICIFAGGMFTMFVGFSAIIIFLHYSLGEIRDSKPWGKK